MADTRYQKEFVEGWIRTHYLVPLLNQPFKKDFLTCTDGGIFECDAVSTDGTFAVMISTSGARAAGGRRAQGSVKKVLFDAYHLSRLLNPTTRMILCTEPDMVKFLEGQKKKGRLPSTVDIRQVELPTDIRRDLDYHRRVSVEEQSHKDRPPKP